MGALKAPIGKAGVDHPAANLFLFFFLIFLSAKLSHARDLWRLRLVVALWDPFGVI